MRKKGWKLMLRAGPLLLLLLAATGLNAQAFLGIGNSVSWKEEVQLHDGRKIIVERSQTHGGRGEVGQSPIKEHSITFTLPGSKEKITWKDEYTEDVGRSSFLLVALHILNDTAYIVASPNLCLSYNKWGRPNPPYVIFKNDGKEWQRIQLSDLPLVFKEVNLVVEPRGLKEEKLLNRGLASTEMVKELNSSHSKYPSISPEFQTILRTPLETGKNSASNVDCEVAVRKETGDGWRDFDIRSIHSYKECQEKCSIQNISDKNCPCGNLLNSKPEWRKSNGNAN